MTRGKPPDRGLGGLADALFKAGITPPPAESPAKEREREGRPRNGPSDRASGSRDRGKSPDRGGPSERRGGAATTRAPQFDSPRELDDERLESLRARIRGSVVGGRGPKRWFFVARDRRVPFVDVSEGLSKLLTEGVAGVVESLGAATERHVVISDTATLSALDDADPGLVRFWNRARSS